MVVLANPVLEQISLVNFPKPSDGYDGIIPVIDLSLPNSSEALVRACEDFGFFKVTNHGVSVDLMQRLETEAMKFFSMPLIEKEKSGPATPFGYGNKRIGFNGDMGWLEYILLSTSSSNPLSYTSLPCLEEPSATLFRSYLDEYITSVRRLGCEVLELITDGLRIEQRDVISELVMNEDSDGIFRLNHYPPCPMLEGFNFSLTGFGEHTDPQIISMLRSNCSSGLQICLKDGTWVPVAPDQNSFFFNLGDSFQVLTNGRFRSVRHRVLANGMKSRVSMIYFFGPSPTTKIAPLPQLMAEGEQSLYKEFTWREYKQAAFKTKLADHRLGPFEK